MKNNFQKKLDQCPNCGELLVWFEQNKAFCPKCKHTIGLFHIQPNTKEKTNNGTKSKKYKTQDKNKENLYFQRLKEITQFKEGRLISESYENMKTPVEIECKKGHRWNATPDNIINGNTWCPTCHFELLSKLFTQYTIDDLKKIAQSRGGDCLNENYLGWDNYHKWICEEEHLWSATPHNVIAGGTWCSFCAEGELFERVARGILEVLLNEKFPKTIPIWLNLDLIGKPGGRRHLDGYSEKLKIALEVHGIQHYKYEPFYHRNDIQIFVKQQKVDELKRQLCTQNGILLIEIGFIWDGKDLRQLEFFEIEDFYRYYLTNNDIKVPNRSEKINWVPYLSIHRNQDLILKLLIEHGEMNISDIAGSLNINYKTVGRHLKGLASLGLVNLRLGTQNQKSWRVTDSIKDTITEKVDKIPQEKLIDITTQITRQTEKDILDLLGKTNGLTTDQISKELNLSKRTIEGYIKSLELKGFVKYERATGMGQAHPKIWSINDQE